MPLGTINVPPAGSSIKRNFSAIPLPCPDSRKLMPDRTIFPVASNFVSFFAAAILSWKVFGGPSIPASLKCALFQNNAGVLNNIGTP